MEPVFVRWYNKVVEGVLAKESDLMGMTAVSIPIQGVQAVALFHPDHVYNNVQAASYGVNNKIVTQEKYEELKDQVREKLSQPATLDEEYEKLQKFKEQHWNHERNMLELDYWPAYDQMFHAYMRKRLGRKKPQQVEMVNTVIPSTDVADPNAFAREWIEYTNGMKIECPETEEEAATWKKPEETTVMPRTIGKPYTVTELTLF